MPRTFKVLQVGGKDLESLFENKRGVEWDYLDTALFEFDSGYIEAVEALINEKGAFDFVFIQAPYSKSLINLFKLVSMPYNTVIDEAYWGSHFQDEETVKRNFIKPMTYDNEESLHQKLQAITFPGQYGDKVSPIHCRVNTSFIGQYQFNGNESLEISGDFGERLTPLVTWSRNIIADENKVNQIWPEFKVDGNISIEYTLRIIPVYSTDQPVETFIFEQHELDKPIELPSRSYKANVSISLKAKGKGNLYIGAIHKRWSRLELGEFILGGQRYSDHDRNEFMHYFNPGDFKPPLNVYFSGYRTAEGFEGYFMMDRLNAPFILISDPRIEGGAFYLGSETYEDAIRKVITEALDYLGFSHRQLILSGLSMGSFGALYYSTYLQPSAVIVGKPLINVGTIANNMRLVRPNDFGTALDVLRFNEDGISENEVKQLDRKFWNQLRKSQLTHTTFAIAYMEHDDYDTHAFRDLLPLLTEQHARVMSRSVPGRHNDDSSTITNWFINFYHLIMAQQFGRETDARS